MNKVTLYIVDDCILNRVNYKKLIEENKNYTVINDFSTVQECFYEMKKKQVDIILTDIELNDINAIRELILIREHFPRTKIVVLSSSENEEKILAILSIGICGYILKENAPRLKEIIPNIAKGDFWVDSEIAKSVFSSLILFNFGKSEGKHQKIEISLTKRERQVLRLMIQGKTNTEIAREIEISVNTAKAHVGSILTKLNVKDRVQAVVKAVKGNII